MVCEGCETMRQFVRKALVLAISASFVFSLAMMTGCDEFSDTPEQKDENIALAETGEESPEAVAAREAEEARAAEEAKAAEAARAAEEAAEQEQRRIEAERQAATREAERASRTCWITQTGHKYHLSDGCRTLARSKNLSTMTVSQAKAQGYDPCEVCA